MHIRTKPARRHNSDSEHNQYGIWNWFKNKNKITDKEIIMECVYQFCVKKGFDMKDKKNERSMLNFCGNRFSHFATFASQYLIDNNYIAKS